MPSESEIIIAFLFNRSGKTMMGSSDLYLALSMDLNWFTPNDAKDFVNYAVKNKLLKKDGKLLRPAFDYTKIVVPVGFYPSKKVLDEKVEIKEIQEGSLLDKIIKKIVEETDLSGNQVLEKINRTSEEKNITSEVAALLIGKELDVNLDEVVEKIENSFS